MGVPTAAAVLHSLGEVPPASPWPHWDEAMAALPSAPDLLDPVLVAARAGMAGLPAGNLRLLDEVRIRIAADPALLRLAWYAHWRILVAPQHGTFQGGPGLDAHLGGLAGMFWQLVSLGFPAALAALHRRRGYPAEVTAATAACIAEYDANHRRGTGRAGSYPGQVGWLSTYLVDDPYVRLGRFAFQSHPWRGQAGLWRNPAGEVLALAEPGKRVDANGLIAPAEVPDQDVWTTTLAGSEAAVTGYPISGDGRILRRTVTLEQPAWTPLLRPGDRCLDIHIPAGGGMDWTACADALRQAAAFFPRHHPDQPAAAFACTTWFLDPQLAGLLPADANPLRLQRHAYLVPCDPWQGGLWFVFLRPTPAGVDVATLPQTTSLQRTLAAHLAAGGRWHGGSLLIPVADLATLDEGRYTSMAQRVLAGL